MVGRVTGLAATLVVTALLFGSSAASGHAFLDRAEPRVGSTVKIAPTQVRVWFTEQLEAAFSILGVQVRVRLRQLRQGGPKRGDLRQSGG